MADRNNDSIYYEMEVDSANMWKIAKKATAEWQPLAGEWASLQITVPYNASDRCLVSVVNGLIRGGILPNWECLLSVTVFRMHQNFYHLQLRDWNG